MINIFVFTRLGGGGGGGRGGGGGVGGEAVVAGQIDPPPTTCRPQSRLAFRSEQAHSIQQAQLLGRFKGA